MAREFEDRNNMIEQDGWIMGEYVTDNDIYYDFHTYGLQYNYGHLDLQIVLPMDTETAYTIFTHLAAEIADGIVFEEDSIYPDLLSYNKIKFKKFIHEEREVLRVILSDHRGKFPDQKDCHINFQFQEDDFRFIGSFAWKDGHLIL